MHVRNIIIALCAVTTVALVGCTEVTFVTNEAPTGLPPVSTDDASAAGDAGVMAMADAGLPGSDAGAVEVDAGTSEVDAGTDAGSAETGVSVSMASYPVSSVAVRNEPLIPTVGLVFTGSGSSDVHVRSVRLTGRGDIEGSTFARENLNDVVTFCTLYEGPASLGLGMSPDPETGEMLFTGIDLVVTRGGSRTLTVRCSTDSVVSRETGDRFAVGIVSGEDIAVENPAGERLAAVITMPLYQNTELAPVNAVTVMPHGWVSYEADTMRQSTILVADGGAVWQNFAQVRATAILEGADLGVVRIKSGGDASSFTQVAVALEGAVLGSCILPAGSNSSCDATLASPIRIEHDSSRPFQIWGKLANVVSGASVMGATVGVPRSGVGVSLGVDANVVSGDWDVSYTGSLNVRATGIVSGTRLYTASAAILGNTFRVRKSKPTVTRQTLTTTTLTNGTSQDLYRFQASADAAGPVSFHSIAFDVTAVGTLTLSGFGLRRGSSLMDTSEYDIVDEYVNNLEAGALSFFTGVATHRIVIVFHNDGEMVTGSGNVYTLQATPFGVEAGDSITLSFYRTMNGSTGYLLDDPIHSSLDTSAWGSPRTGPVIAAGFIWSDLSEVPHSDYYGCCGGSRDWTDGHLVEDLTQTQTLSR